MGETFGGIDLIISYVNNGQLSSQFNFNLYDVAQPVFLNADNSFELLDLQMQKTFSVYGVNHLMANIMDSHDKIRYMAYADGDIEINSNTAKEIGWTDPPKVDHASSYKKLQLHLAYILTIPGVPVIYYGDEIGMTGAADPDNRRMMRFDNDLNIYEKENLKEIPRKQRYINRLSLKEVLNYQNKNQRDHVMCIAHLQYAYTLKEIAEYLGIHYTTVSRAVKRIEEKDKM